MIRPQLDIADVSGSKVKSPERLIHAESTKSLHLSMLFTDQELSSGTGFLVAHAGDYYLITNRHNVTGRDNITGKLLSKMGAVPNRISIRHPLKDRLGSWVTKTQPLLADDKPLWIEHPYLKGKADFVALKLIDLSHVQLNPYSLDVKENDVAVAPAEAVSVIGFPFGNSAEGFAIWATGFIATDPSLNFDGLPVTLIDCRTRQGQSGSPVIAFRSGGGFNSTGGFTISSGPVSKFLGIYSGRINNESDLGMMWKAAAIRELINSLTPPVLGPIFSYGGRVG